MPRIFSFVGSPVRHPLAVATPDATDRMVNLPIRKIHDLPVYSIHA